MNKSTTSESIHKKTMFFGHSLPNGNRTGLAIDSPIKFIASDKYVQAEEKIINSFLSVYETAAWDVLNHHIKNVGDKKIDCYEIIVGDWWDNTKELWTVKFYFDITDCLELMGHYR
jgi:hypothetical protein